MSDVGPAEAFAAFREALFDDVHLMLWLRAPMERDAYVAEVVAVGAARGFVFDEAAARAVLREGEQTWLMQAGDIV